MNRKNNSRRKLTKAISQLAPMPQRGEESSMRDFSDALFKFLRHMDAKANVTIQKYPTGLGWYGGYFRPEQKKPKTEPCWSKRLAQLLSAAGYAAQDNVRYEPSSHRRKCDIVVTLPNNCRLWIEVKGAWKEYWRKNKGEWIYRLTFPSNGGQAGIT